MKSVMPTCVVALAALLGQSYCAQTALAQVAPAPTLMNFQGRLAKPDGTPVANGTYTIQFSLFDALTSGNQKWTQTVSGVVVKNGTFAVLLSGFGATVFNTDSWLEIKVGTDNSLTPRQQLVSVAYAMKANVVSDGSITAASIAAGTITAAKLADGSITTAKIADSSITTAKLVDGAITAPKLDPNVFNSTVWLLGGNSGVTSGSLGTTDLNPLTLKVNGHRGVQYLYAENTGNAFRSVNVLGGSEINTVGSGVTGATVGGGGLDYFSGTDYPNRVTGDFGTVGGGYGNTAGKYATIGGGASNTASADYSAVTGGQNNVANGIDSGILGGSTNGASGIYSVVAGGNANVASGANSFIGGGANNTAVGANSFVAGGSLNAAGGQYAFAGGFGASAAHAGAFVWSDSQGTTLASTGVNQFLVRAGGGVGINTNNPGGFALNVNGTAKINGNLTVNTTTYTSDARYKRNVAPLDDALDVLLALRGVTYEWRREEFREQNFGGGRQIGFIAQEVERVLPELVVTDANGFKSVAYVQVVPVLVEAVKELKRENDAMKRENAEMKVRLATIEKLLEKKSGAGN